MNFILGCLLGAVLGFIAGGVYCWVFVGTKFILMRPYNGNLEGLRTDLRARGFEEQGPALHTVVGRNGGAN